MRDAGRHFNSIGLHYYTIANNWTNKGSATVFEEAEYAKTLQQTLRMDGIITRHAAIMDKYDRDKKVWLAVDEWGTWFDTEPGTNPGFLYQQNTLRDALVAALNINVFIKHADRVKMANIAQPINVLQAMILTKEDKMVLDADLSRVRNVQVLPGRDYACHRREVTLVWQRRLHHACHRCLRCPR